MQADLKLALADAIGGLFHKTELGSQVVFYAVSDRTVNPVPVEILNRLSIPDVFLHIHEKLQRS